MTSARVRGHALIAEGWPHDHEGRRCCYGSFDVGRAKCSCGVMSVDLFSTAARKRWHREHKAAVLAAVPPEGDPT